MPDPDTPQDIRPADTEEDGVLTLNQEPVPSIIFRQDNPPKALMTISHEMGTVGIKVEQEFLRGITFLEEKAKAAYDELRSEFGVDEANEPTFHGLLHDLMEGALNAFHKNAYAIAQNNAAKQEQPVETPVQPAAVEGDEEHHAG